MKTDHHLDLPRRLQIEFSQVIQRHTDGEGGEVDAAPDVADLRGRVPRARRRSSWSSSPSASDEGTERITATVRAYGTEHELSGVGNGPIAAFCEALSPIDIGLGGVSVRVLDYARARAHRRAATPRPPPTSRSRSATGCCGASGISESIVQASLRGVISALNRAARAQAGQ